MKIRKSVVAALLIGTAAVNGACESIAEPGYFAGIGLGYSLSDIDGPKIRKELCGGDVICTIKSYSHDENDLGFKLYGGYLFNENFALEGGYFNLGEYSFHTEGEDATTRYIYEGTSQMHGLHIDAIGYLPLNENLSLTARLGVMYAEVKEEYAYSEGGIEGDLYVNGSAKEKSPDKRDVGFKYGVGLQYDFTPAFGVRGEWENYHLEEAIAAGADLTLFSLGIVYRFGVPEPEPLIIEKEVVKEVEVPVVIEKKVEVPVVVEKEVIKEVEVPAEPIVFIKPGERIILASNSLFDFDKSDLKPQGKAALRDLMKKIRKDDNLIITGHTCSMGSEIYNLKLSERRASSVMNYLIANGIAPERLEMRARGESEPIASNATEEGRIQNRRVEIEVVAGHKEEGAAE
jgi:OOP family OmpA-OmpF porin